ncbi:MAG: hypothetical protein PHP08_00210 [Candidatus Dojkabacteria bacterium]|nr:hypothetical protein [Candidatus Dojkabacteria bacterium]
MNEDKYLRQYFDVWYESLYIMKNHKDKGEAANEGLCFIKTEDE